MNSPAGFVTAEERPRRRMSLRWLKGRIPLLLMLAALCSFAFRTNDVFIGAAAAGSAAALGAAWLQIFRLREFRLSWILADGLLLGYAVGTFNSAARLWLAGIPVAEYFGRQQEDLSVALTAVLLVCALLFWYGGVTRPFRLDPARLRSSDFPLICFGALLVSAGILTGKLGYQGVSATSEGRVSILGELAATIAPALPAFTLLLQTKLRSRPSRVLCGIVAAAALAAMVPQGRRALLYAVLLSVLAFCLRRGGLRLTTWKTGLMLASAAVLLYAGNVFFFAMRVSTYTTGTTSMTLPGLMENALSVLQNHGGGRLDDLLAKNLRDRTFIIRYLSDLLHASATHQPLHGADLVYCLESALPSVLYPDKDRIRAIGMEENLANPQFGLFPTDEANSILTTGVSDFGVAGMFLYPVALIALMEFFLKMIGRRMPEGAQAFLILCVLDTIWQTELSTSAYFVLGRNLLLLSFPLVFLSRLSRLLLNPSGRRRRPERIGWEAATGLDAAV
jgi:hypothetical protein